MQKIERLETVLRDVIDAADRVTASWEAGDLAGAVIFDLGFNAEIARQTLAEVREG